MSRARSVPAALSLLFFAPLATAQRGSQAVHRVDAVVGAPSAAAPQCAGLPNALGVEMLP